jgi:catechol 2,3-dioxygenase-like lactoylglutathione lyase family enzyme
MTEITQIVPVLPSQDIARDVDWYSEHVGFDVVFSDPMYAVLRRGGFWLHLQWHADTPDDPLLGGSVIRIVVEDIESAFTEFLARGTVTPDKLRRDTPWGTHEFGFWDLNRNAIFVVEVLA